MYSLKYRITLESPVIIARSSGERNIVRTFDFIPGTTILGMFAGKYIQQNTLNDAHLDPVFASWFLSEDIAFTNGYIVSRDAKDNHCINFPVPFSIQEEKNNPGILYDLFFMKTNKQTKSLRGYCRLNGNKLIKAEPKTSLNFHHARDKEAGAAKEGGIFNYESLDKDQIFEGFIISTQDILEKFYKEFSSFTDYYIGRSKNSQYGKVKFEFIDKSPQRFENIIPGFNFGQENINGSVSLTFLSDVILYDEYGYSATDEKTLVNYLKNNISPDLILEKAIFKPGFVENYVSVWRLKKPAETSFQAGSAFLLKNVKREDYNKLLLLQKEGIGERKNEGLGRIVFGWQTSGNLNTENYAEAEKKNLHQKYLTSLERSYGKHSSS